MCWGIWGVGRGASELVWAWGEGEGVGVGVAFSWCLCFRDEYGVGIPKWQIQFVFYYCFLGYWFGWNQV